MSRFQRLLVVFAVALAWGFPSLAGESKVYTNKDLPKDETKVYTNADLPSAGGAKAEGKGGTKKAVTNEDLKSEGGNLTYTDPADDHTYENMLPREKSDPRATRRRNAEIRALKMEYRTLRLRQDEIEAELPEAREAAKQEMGEGFAIINGVPTRVVSTDLLPEGEAHRRLRELEDEERRVSRDIDRIEARAHDEYAMGRPGLMQD